MINLIETAFCKRNDFRLLSVQLFYVYICISTHFPVPDHSPTSVAGGFVNGTTIYVTWGVIPLRFRNGIIQSYSVAYKQKNSSEDWKVISVNSQRFRIEIGSLHYNKLYDVRVAGKTSVGVGPYSIPISIRTDGYGMKFKILISFNYNRSNTL